MRPRPSRPAPFEDVRMRGFARRTTVADVLTWIDSIAAHLPAETTSVSDAAGRVLAEDITSDIHVPSFRRAMMDGYALQAANTLGATPYNELTVEVIGEVLPGEGFPDVISAGKAVRIMTGAPIPEGADAVLPAEKATQEGTTLRIQDEVPPLKHVGRVGEDIEQGTVVLRRGRRLRPQDLGVLSCLARAEVQVIRRPRVRLIVTGNELCPAGTAPRQYQTVDANSSVLRALISRDGGIVQFGGITPDAPDSIRSGMADPGTDVVVVSGGSSVGQEDHAPRLLAELGELAIHGVAMRPSSPTGMGRVHDRIVFLLPGNPVSCLCAYDFFAGRAIRLLGGRSAEWPYRQATGVLSRKISSVVGRHDYARVAYDEGRVEPIAVAGASVLSSTSRADGFVIVPADSEGFPPGAEVEVYLYDQVSI